MISELQKIDELLELSSTCSQALVVAVSDLAETSIEWASTENKTELQKRARDSISNACP